jgi:hypothetical protein
MLVLSPLAETRGMEVGKDVQPLAAVEITAGSYLGFFTGW